MSILDLDHSINKKKLLKSGWAEGVWGAPDKIIHDNNNCIDRHNHVCMFRPTQTVYDYTSRRNSTKKYYYDLTFFPNGFDAYITNIKKPDGPFVMCTDSNIKNVEGTIWEVSDMDDIELIIATLNSKILKIQ